MRTYTLLLCFICWAPALSSVATEIFIAPAPLGVDSNPGSFEKPKADVQSVCWQLKPGDVVTLRAGTYRKPLYLGKAGTADAPITLRAAKGEDVIFDGEDEPHGGHDKAMIAMGGNYQVIEGLTIRHSPGQGISIWGKANGVIRNCVITDSWHAGITAVFTDQTSVHHVLIENNRLKNNALSNEKHETLSGWPASVSVGGQACTVRGNVVELGYGEGICAGGDSNIVEGNTVRDHFSACIYLDNSTHSIVCGNFCSQSPTAPCYVAGSTPGYLMAGRSISTGIQIATETNRRSGQNPSSDNLIINNIVSGAKASFFYGNYQQGGGLKNTLVAHNTFVGGDVELLHVDDGPHEGTEFVNNVFVQTQPRPLGKLPLASKGIYFHHNLWHGSQEGMVIGEGDIQSDPLFKKPVGGKPEDFLLQATSPAKAKAIRQTRVTDDFFNRQRLEQSDLGAISL